jgi:hypothetical protein
MVVTLASLCSAAWRALSRSAIVVDGSRFSTARTSQLGRFVVGMIVVTLMEAPALHLILHRQSLLVHLFVLGLNLLTIVWLLGDRRLIEESGHRLGDDALELALGRRWQGRLAYTQLRSARRIEGIGPLSRRRAPAPRTLRLTPLDTPNVELVLRAPTRLRRPPLGIARPVERVQLFVDEPDRFVAALATRLPPAE